MSHNLKETRKTGSGCSERRQVFISRVRRQKRGRGSPSPTMSDAPLLPMEPRPSGWQRISQVALVASLAGGSLLALLAWRQGTTTSEVAAKRDVDASFYPRPGHKLQVQPNAFTVNDWECMVLDTKLWPSERVHCELAPDETYRWVVEHFDDPNCTRLNKANPYAVHGTGCFLFKQYNQVTPSLPSAPPRPCHASMQGRAARTLRCAI